MDQAQEQHRPSLDETNHHTSEEGKTENTLLKGENDIARERRIIRKVDLRLLPFLALAYSIGLIDRTNLPVARIAGMDTDLELTVGDRYSIVACLFFVPYVILQLPSNIFLRRLGPRICLTFYIITWGAVELAMAFVPNWGVLAVCRVLLGMLEAGFFPGMVFIITTWYKRHEVQKRLAAFWLTSIIIGGFSSILAYAIQLLKGKRGLNGWQWIFIVEGAITIVIGIGVWFFLEAFPDQNKFLSKEETDIVLERVQDDRGDALPDEITLKKVLHHLGDWTIWVYALCFMCATMPAYVIGYFSNIILLGMGWNLAQSFILAAPPFVFAAISTFIFAYVADRTRTRGVWIVIQSLVCLVGLFLIGYATPSGVRYLGLFLMNAGAQGCIPAILAYNANNVRSHSKRSVSSALIISWGGIGGIFATTVFREKDRPRYLNGIWATIGCQFLLILLVGLLTLTYMRRNRLARKGTVVWEERSGFLYTL